MSTIDVSKHATFKQLQALYANRQGNSIVGSKAEYNTESVYNRMNELAIKQCEAMIKTRQAYEADINNSYPPSWDNVIDNDSHLDSINNIEPIDNDSHLDSINNIEPIDNDSQLQVSDLDLSYINIKFKFKNTIWNELTSESKDYWANLMIS